MKSLITNLFTMCGGSNANFLRMSHDDFKRGGIGYCKERKPPFYSLKSKEKNVGNKYLKIRPENKNKTIATEL